jgi:putative ABC transport system permease protein
LQQNSTRWATIIASRVSRQKTKFFIAIANITFANLLILIQPGFEGALYDSAKIPYQNLNADLMIGNTRSQTRFEFLHDFCM